MFEQVKQVLVDAIHVDEEAINLNANLKDDLNIDSLAAVELALELETEFDIRIEDEELAKLVTVNDVVEILNQKTTLIDNTSLELKIGSLIDNLISIFDQEIENPTNYMDSYQDLGKYVELLDGTMSKILGIDEYGRLIVDDQKLVSTQQIRRIFDGN